MGTVPSAQVLNPPGRLDRPSTRRLTARVQGPHLAREGGRLRVHGDTGQTGSRVRVHGDTGQTRSRVRVHGASAFTVRAFRVWGFTTYDKETGTRD